MEGDVSQTFVNDEDVDESVLADEGKDLLIEAAEAGLPVLVRPQSEPVELPVTPEVSELTRMVQLAATWQHAKLVPEALREKPADVLLIMYTARSLGIDFATGFRELYVIDGKVSMSQKQKLALVRKSRLASVWPATDNDGESATWYAIRADQPDVTYSSTFTIEEARKVEARERGQTITLAEKSTWRQYPARMLSWRALGYLLDDCVPEVGTGIYSPDELGAITDDEGNVIDVSEVQPLIQSDQDRRRSERAEAKAELAPEDARVALKARIDALPMQVKLDTEPNKRDGLGNRWKDAKMPPVMEMTADLLRRATKMVEGYEAKAKALGLELAPAAEIPDDPEFDVDGDGGEAPESPQDDSVPDGAPEAPAAQEATEERPIPADLVEAGKAACGIEDETEERRFIAAAIKSHVEGVSEVEADPIIKTVQAMSWQAVDKLLVQHGIGNPSSMHVQSRRMLATAILITERPMDADKGDSF